VRLGISNIAWPPDLDEDVSEVLKSGGLCSIDIAPSKYFDLSRKCQEPEIGAVRKAWESRGFQINGMQSLLFGSNLNLFESDVQREDMLNWLDNVCFIGRNLGAKNLVFGSPKNRNREGLSDKEAHRVAFDFFSKVGDLADRHSVSVCLEPNPPEYGANFLVSSVETARFVSELGHPSIKMQLDTGALVFDDNEGTTGFEFDRLLIGHIHLSAPQLTPLHLSESNTMMHLVRAMRFSEDYAPTIEMLTSSPEVAVSEIEHSIEFVLDLWSRTLVGLGK
jgi:D-psicose/D-tagatose/L-ribulose 3-epimerase